MAVLSHPAFLGCFALFFRLNACHPRRGLFCACSHDSGWQVGFICWGQRWLLPRPAERMVGLEGGKPVDACGGHGSILTFGLDPITFNCCVDGFNTKELVAEAQLFTPAPGGDIGLLLHHLRCFEVLWWPFWGRGRSVETGSPSHIGVTRCHVSKRGQGSPK